MDPRALVAEALGTALLLAVVTGSGIMGSELAGDDVAMALLANALATGLGLAVLIAVFGPLSGAHFNPAVSLAFCLRGDLPRRQAVGYVLAQLSGAWAGVLAAHLMFDQPLLQVSATERVGGHLFVSEVLATMGLIGVIFGGVRYRPDGVPWLVGAYIGAAYWFTASTSFANPAVTIARTGTDTFVGIDPASAPAFLLAQCVAAVLIVPAAGWLFGTGGAETAPDAGSLAEG